MAITLPTTEPLTPQEMAQRAGVPADWLYRQIEIGAISGHRSAWLTLFPSTDAPKIAEKYERYREMKQYRQDHQNRNRTGK